MQACKGRGLVMLSLAHDEGVLATQGEGRGFTMCLALRLHVA
jgi:hypothetical protein